MTLQKNKSNFLLNVLLCVMLVFTLFGALFIGNREGVSAKADTDITETLGLEDRSNWNDLKNPDVAIFGVMDANQYFKSFMPVGVSGCWYKGNTTTIEQNNNVDIMQYIYVNDKSAREWLNENTSGQYTTSSPAGWLANPAAWPIAVETVGDVWIRIDKTKFGGNFTFTFKAGFSLIREDGEVCTTSEDIVYTYQNGALGGRVVDRSYTLSFEGMDETITVKGSEKLGELPAVPERAGYAGFWAIDGTPISANSTISANATATPMYALEYQDLLGLEDRAWGAHDGEYYFGGVTLSPFGYFNSADSVCNAWYVGNPAPITANNGVDIMEYIYVNDKSARELITTNAKGDRYVNDCNCWLSNPAASPVYVETTNGSGILIKLLKSAFDDSFTITFKAGFSLIRNDGELIYVSNDITYTYANGTLTDTSRVNVAFDGENVQLVGIGRKAVAPATVPTKEETESHTYAFDGWYNGETKWNFDDPVTAAMNLTSRFIETEKMKYSVIFNADNGTENVVVSVYENSYVKEDQIPANPEKTTDGEFAYTFVCWSADGENAYDFTAPVTQEVALTAVYSTKPLYTVTMGNETVKVLEGEKVEKPADPTQESTAEFDYIFEGWYNGETKWDFENDVVTGDMELVAKFTESKRNYTVTFVVTGNEAVTLAPVSVEYGTAYDLNNLLEGVDVSAYYYTVTVNGEAVTSVEVLGDVTVDVAFVARVFYTVTIDGVDQTVEEGEKAVAPATEPTRESTAEFDYTFEGWYNGETKWDFENDTVTGDTELVAKYTETKRKYTVSFNVTGNDSIKLDAVEVEYGTAYDLSSLLEGKDVTGYTYTVSVGGVEKASITVTANTTVDVAFTQVVEQQPAGNGEASGCNGCNGSISAMGAMLTAISLGVVAVLRKKED